MENSIKTTPFNTIGSINKANISKKWSLDADGKTIYWSTSRERVNVIRRGIPYGSIEFISGKINSPVKMVLSLVGLPQTTYNKKKSDHALLDKGDSELILRISELIDFGIEVFNMEEEKFQRWLKKPNISLNRVAPINFLDTISGINEVKYCLNRIEYGNFA